MIADMRVLQDDPAPFTLKAGPTGVLLLHGFMGTPREMQPLGEYLHSRGVTISAPLLPGHGGTLSDLNQTSWWAWVAAAEVAYADLAARCARVGVAGFSMGSLLALWLAAHHPALPALVLYAPALKVRYRLIGLAVLARYALRTFPVVVNGSDLQDPAAEVFLGGYDCYPVAATAELYFLIRRVTRLVSHVRAPTLVVYSRGDQLLHPTSGPETIARLSQAAPSVETLVLEKAGHALVVDQGWQDVAEATYRFIAEMLLSS
jgi:carboxylesterase